VAKKDLTPAERRAPKVVHLDELDSVPGPGTLTWRPVRLALGIRAFGTNAYTAGAAGQDVVEPHTENPALAHEELYFVASGRARFEVDDQVYDAPAGTYVFIPDPASHRYAVAEEPGTTVLSFGGPPTFQPSAWEWFFRAYAVREKDPDEARRLLAEALEHHPESPGAHFHLACIEALEGRRDEALAALRFAIDREPGLAAEAREDEDFAALSDDPEFRALVAG
jgi:quercetin dioxygenase-like cupin family protein